MKKRIREKILEWENDIGTIDCDIEYMIALIKDEYSEGNDSFKLGRIATLLSILEQKTGRLRKDMDTVLNRYPEIVNKACS